MNIFIFCLAMVAMFLSTPVRVFAQEQAAAPVFQEGDTWQFRVTERDFRAQTTKGMDGDYEVTYSRGKVKVRRPGGEEIEFRQGNELIRILGSESDERQYLQFPLVVGKKWSTSFQAEARRGGAQMNRRNETSVTGVEQINVPAGSYQVFKVERYEQLAQAGKTGKSAGKVHHSRYTYYYSPQTRSIVKYDYESGEDGGRREIELIKFTPGR